MLRTRIITAVLALIPMIAVFVYGDSLLLRALFTVLVGISAFEMGSMLFHSFQQRQELPRDNKPVVITVLLAMLVYASVVFVEIPSVGHVGVAFLLAILIGTFSAKSVEQSYFYTSGYLVSLAYAIFPFVAVWELYAASSDSRYIFLLCAIVWSGDTGAYFAGRTLGKHKLAPRMSPNKTWEGAVGGLIASLIGGSCLNLYYGQENLMSWPWLVVACLFGGIFGQLGDLTESTFKRFAGVKDSGKIFPGHGGFLDRVDGLLFAAPVIWFILYQFGS